MEAVTTAQMAGELDWQQSLRGALRTVEELVAAGLLAPGQSLAERQALSRFSICVPEALARRFDHTDLARCPLYRQAVPWAGERDPESLPPWANAASQQLYGRALPWSGDPIGDVERLAAPRLTHRYRSRALLHVTSACALYCRYCFRKTHLSERTDVLYRGGFAPALAYLKATPAIREVVLTGGDPLTLVDAALARLLHELAACDGVEVVRLHTRLPSVLPERLTAGLADVLRSTRLQVVVACHANHAKEWGTAAKEGLARLRRAGVTLLLQSVLLRGINDRAEILAELWQQAYAHGVLPFYLHHPDWTIGTWAYRVGIAKGRRLMAALAGEVTGPALPRYVLDVPGGAGKVDLNGHGVRELEAHRAQGGIAGALWRVTLPSTRDATAAANSDGNQQPLASADEMPGLKSCDYLDLWPEL